MFESSTEHWLFQLVTRDANSVAVFCGWKCIPMFLDLQPLQALMIHIRFFAARWREYYAAIRQANNSPVQGGSADLVAEAMVKARGRWESLWFLDQFMQIYGDFEGFPLVPCLGGNIMTPVDWTPQLVLYPKSWSFFKLFWTLSMAICWVSVLRWSTMVYLKGPKRYLNMFKKQIQIHIYIYRLMSAS